MVKWIVVMKIQPSICLNDWGKPRKKPQSGWLAPGFEPGTSRMRVSCVTTEPPRSVSILCCSREKRGNQRKNAPNGAQKRLIFLKRKDSDRKGGLPATSTSCPGHLSRKFLTSAFTFPWRYKNYSAEHIHVFQHTYPQTHSITLSLTHTHMDMYKNRLICAAEEFLELYGKVEAVVRNYLLRWSGYLFAVPNTHLFDLYFFFKHITLFMLR